MPWKDGSVEEIISMVNSLPGLVRLRFEHCYFEDDDLEGLLSNLPNLRALSLTGRFGESFGDDMGSYLTDKGLGFIAQCCPNLRSLDVSYHRQVTVSGVKATVDNCTHLRELYISNTREDMKKVASLATRSDTLLLLKCFGGFSPNKEHFREAIMASGG